jgi:hypothetical protein
LRRSKLNLFTIKHKLLEKEQNGGGEGKPYCKSDKDVGEVVYAYSDTGEGDEESKEMEWQGISREIRSYNKGYAGHSSCVSGWEGILAINFQIEARYFGGASSPYQILEDSRQHSG